jgi:HPt (histidine-containing phosphotransfer) domain-containing protein
MLIYDHNKKFLGIDSDDLKHLGFASAESLFEQCSDVADLFVKRPGYIHNFKNFEWIDFVLHAEAEDSKAIIHTAKSNFTCKLLIKPFYLNSEPSQSAYMVLLQNLKPLSAEEDAKVAHDIEMHPMPTPSASIAQTIPSPHMPLPDVSLPNFDDMPATELNEPDIFDVPEETDSFAMPDIKESVSESPFKLDLIDDDEAHSPFKMEVEAESEAENENDLNPFFKENEKTIESAVAPKQDETDAPNPVTPSRSNLPDIPMLGDRLSKKDHEYIDALTTDRDYVYNPEVAANELGLPVDLIEEFIGDFIQQSHDFHDELFEKVAAHDRESVQTLSHKLKGVAANLRIEDAFEVLAIINTSHDFEEIMANLKYYYHLVAKLEGDEEYLALENDDTQAKSSQEAAPEPANELEEESMNLFDKPVEKTLQEEVEKSEDDDIYDFDKTEKDVEPFDVPHKPPTFDDEEDDDIYDFDAISASLSEEDDDALTETPKEEEEELFELKQRDDEPFLVMEPQEEKTPEALPDRELLDIMDTSESLPVDSDETFKFDELADQFKALEEEASSKEEVVETEDETIQESTPEKELPEAVETVQEEILHYDVSMVSNELGLSEHLVKELIEDFKTDTLLHVDEISTAIASFDSATWQKLAHEYKGISDNLRLIEISDELQTLMRTNDAQKAKTALGRYRNYVNQL